MTPTETQIARAERIADEHGGVRVAFEWAFARKVALAAIMETQEWAAGVADRLGGVRGPHDAVSQSNRAQHVRARTIAAAIRAGEQQ